MQRTLNGIDFVKALKRCSDAPVIFVSAWAEDVERMLRGTEFEAADYIQCPFSLRDLLARVKLVVEKGQAHA
jgi:two-component system OmpR family response regulator